MNTTTESTKSRTRITRQWVEYDVYQAFDRLAKIRPDFDCRVETIEGETVENTLIFCQLTFYNVGPNLFTQRLLHFVILALRPSFL